MADEIFETANCFVNLGGDTLNSVPKYDMTAGEIAILQMIHGKDAITEIEPTGVVKRANRAEKARLTATYSKAHDGNGNSLLEKLYPGAASRIFQRIDELELASVQFKAGSAPEGLDDAADEAMEEVKDGLLMSDDVGVLS